MLPAAVEALTARSLRYRPHPRKERWLNRSRLLGAVVLAVALVTGMVSTEGPAGPRAAYHAAIRLLGTTLGVGGSFEGFGLSNPLLLYGTAIPQGDSFHSVPYPGQINLDYPLVSTLPVLSDIPYWPQTLKRSESIGAGYLLQDLAAAPTGEKVTILGLSQGAGVAEIARAEMAKDPEYVADAHNYRFVLVGDPYQPNGGILARFSSWTNAWLLSDLFPFGRPGPSDSPFPTTVYQNQYDGFADFPANFNLLAVVNAIFGMVFEHTFPGYYFTDPDDPAAVTTTVGNTTYVTIPKRLPLLAPLRILASLVGAQRFVDALDPILRVFVEMAYDRTADPSQVREFSWTTPVEKVGAAFAALPAALAQSWAVLWGAPYTPTVPVPDVSAAGLPTPVTEHPVRLPSTSPAALLVRQVVVTLTNLLTQVTQPLAALLRAISGKALPQSASPAMAATDRAVEAAAVAPAPTPTTVDPRPVATSAPVAPRELGGGTAELTVRAADSANPPDSSPTVAAPGSDGVDLFDTPDESSGAPTEAVTAAPTESLDDRPDPDRAAAEDIDAESAAEDDSAVTAADAPTTDPPVADDALGRSPAQAGDAGPGPEPSAPSAEENTTGGSQ